MEARGLNLVSCRHICAQIVTRSYQPIKWLVLCTLQLSSCRSSTPSPYSCHLIWIIFYPVACYFCFLSVAYWVMLTQGSLHAQRSSLPKTNTSNLQMCRNGYMVLVLGRRSLVLASKWTLISWAFQLNLSEPSCQLLTVFNLMLRR